MALRVSKIGRIRDYFKSADIDEVEVVLALVQKDVNARTSATSQPALPFHKKARKVRVARVKSNVDAAIPNGQTNEPVTA